MSKSHLEQILSMLNDQELKCGTTSNPKANTAAKTGLSKLNSQNWIIDSGVTNHIISSQIFEYNKNYSSSPIALPSRDKVEIAGK